MQRKNLKTFLALAAAALIGASGCAREQKKPDAAAPAQQQEASQQALSVKTALAEARMVQRAVEATGGLLPWDENTVNSEVAGIVEKVFKDLGDYVKAGDLLVSVDQNVAKLNLDDAMATLKTNLKAVEKEEARLDDATANLERYTELFKEGMVSRSQFDAIKTQYNVSAAQLNEAKARVEQSQARVDIARDRLARTVIKAPVSGEIKKRFVSQGERVAESTKLFTIVSLGTLKFRGTVPENAVPQIRTGQDIEITVEAYRDRRFPGKIVRISPAVDPETRSLEIEASVPNPKALLKPGFFATGKVMTRKEANVPFVPESAVYSFVGITKVFVIENGIAHERQVRTGTRSGESVEIQENIKPGETVATTNLANLYEGAKVTTEK